jgi:hypothetical protein
MGVDGGLRRGFGLRPCRRPASRSGRDPGSTNAGGDSIGEGANRRRRYLAHPPVRVSPVPAGVEEHLGDARRQRSQPLRQHLGRRQLADPQHHLGCPGPDHRGSQEAVERPDHRGIPHPGGGARIAEDHPTQQSGQRHHRVTRPDSLVGATHHDQAALPGEAGQQLGVGRVRSMRCRAGSSMPRLAAGPPVGGLDLGGVTKEWFAHRQVQVDRTRTGRRGHRGGHAARGQGPPRGGRGPLGDAR